MCLSLELARPRLVLTRVLDGGEPEPEPARGCARTPAPTQVLQVQHDGVVMLVLSVLASTKRWSVPAAHGSVRPSAVWS